MPKKQIEIHDSYYYDGHRKKWKIENIANGSVELPSKELVDKWLDNWDRTEGYPQQESALDKLFLRTFPNNSELDDILIKVCTLNDFYSTNIYKVIDVARIIKEIGIDNDLYSETVKPKLIDELNQKVFEQTGRHIYSFASKYFSHHRPKLYPIYDSYVDKMLRFYRDIDKKIVFNDDDLLSYSGFYDAINQFIVNYHLENYTVKEIDKTLWQMGKFHFPKYKENE